MLNKTKLKTKKKDVASKLIKGDLLDETTTQYFKECVLRVELCFGKEAADKFIDSFIEHIARGNK